jgi:hypothetical protein
MRIIDVKYKLGPEDAGLSEDEIARKVGDGIIEFEEAFESLMKIRQKRRIVDESYLREKIMEFEEAFESLMKIRRRRRIDDGSYLREIQSKVTRHGMGGLKKKVKDSEKARRNSRNNQEET